MEHVAGRAVPRGLGAIIRRATATSPDDRYQDVAALAEDVRRVHRGEPPSVLPESAPQRAWRRLNQDPVFAMRVVVALLALAFVTTTASVAYTARERERASNKAARIAETLSLVSARAQLIESALAQVQSKVNGWARAAEQVLAHAEPTEPPWVTAADVRARLPELKARVTERHRQAVTFERAMYVLPPRSGARRRVAPVQPTGASVWPDADMDGPQGGGIRQR